MIIKTGLIPRIAFELFGVPIYWYAILIVGSMILGLIWCKLHDGRFGIKFEQLLDLAIIVLPTAIICARLYYVLFSLDYFLSNPSEIIRIKDGGLAIYGGIIGGIIVIAIFSKIKKLKLLDITDYIAPIVAFCQSIGRWGNYINIEAYGYETNWPIKMEIIEAGITKYVHPTFLYESISTLAIFIILSILSRKRKFSGEITFMYIICYSFIRFFIEGLRTDSLMLFNCRISQILSLALFIVFSIIMINKKNKYKQMSKKVEKER
ncbi:MAG: prolipoprotein diacylglyceryl transferase [Clostridia bacterium]|nr:prolipoprotein diacylglyceryl transferase [Clostridia bacterium]